MAIGPKGGDLLSIGEVQCGVTAHGKSILGERNTLTLQGKCAHVIWLHVCADLAKRIYCRANLMLNAEWST